TVLFVLYPQFHSNIGARPKSGYPAQSYRIAPAVGSI
ncbi:MAG: hypothetical protein ACI94O_001349, partial [Octadecabacter sp.]